MAILLVLICGLLVAVWFCIIAIRTHGTRPSPGESTNQYVMRGCMVWGFLCVVLAVLAYLVFLFSYLISTSLNATTP